MRRSDASILFQSEVDLCSAFISALPSGWTAYPETGGFDILLSRGVDGFQIGIEAKLSLNTKVICQAVEGFYDVTSSGPDCRAVLVPYNKVQRGTETICGLLGITVVSAGQNLSKMQNIFLPHLPSFENDGGQWFEWAPVKRVPLPDYVPDVAAGSPAPVKLTEWKILAIKIIVIIESRGYVTRHDFKALRLDHRRWIGPTGWLAPTDIPGRYTKGPALPDFRLMHPQNFTEIETNFATRMQSLNLQQHLV